MLKLFATKHTVSLASALILEELGTEYGLCLVDIAARAHKLRGKPRQTLGRSQRVPCRYDRESTPNYVGTLCLC